MAVAAKSARGRATGVALVACVLVVCALGATSAHAQYRPAPRSPLWQGLYIGIHGGYGQGSYDVGGTTGASSWDHGGFYGGGHIGYNFQFSPFILGVEADIDASSAAGAHLPAVGNPIASAVDSLGSVRVRFGSTFGAGGWLLAYGTIGYGSGRFSAETLVNGGANHGLMTFGGIVYGGGLEGRLSEAFSVRLEALHFSLDSNSVATGSPFVKAGVEQTVLRLGLTMHTSAWFD